MPKLLKFEIKSFYPSICIFFHMETYRFELTVRMIFQVPRTPKFQLEVTSMVKRR